MNALRGEAEFTFEGVTVKMAATMENIDALSEATGHPAMGVLFERIMGLSSKTVRLAVANFAVAATDANGKELRIRQAVSDLLSRMSATDMALVLQPALLKTINPLVGDTRSVPHDAEQDDEGNAEAVH